MDIQYFVAYFIIYSFLGWLIEIIFRSIINHYLINPGFLRSPFLPIYGFSAIVIIIISDIIQPLPMYLKLLIYGVITTSGEYITSLLFERILGIKLWNYSDQRFNFQARISLKYSLLWVLITYIGLYFVHPVFQKLVMTLDKTLLYYSTLFIFGIMGFDLVVSILMTISFKQKVSLLLKNFQTLENLEIENIFRSIKHFLSSFPNLKKSIQEKLDINLKEKIINKLKVFKTDMDLRLKKKQHLEKEYEALTSDILNNENFLRLKLFIHHNNTSILNHVKKVSYLSYKIAKYWNLDYRSAARGGLLHDFYLYDWHKEEGRPYKNRLHGFEHPKVALQNAEKNFTLNDKERDIIIKHMWPLTLIPPRYKESFIVSFVDKYISSKEFMGRVKNNKIAKKLLKKN